MEENLRRFVDHHVIITGAGSGIGQGIAHRFASEGAKVVVADIDREGGERVTAEIKGKGGTALFLPVNVASEESIKEMVQKAAETFGPVQVEYPMPGFLKPSLQHWKFPPKSGTEFTELMFEVPLCFAGRVPTI
jgi:hypothetical protein